MWLTFNKIDADILVDCRNLENTKNIMPTYKLAKELKITKKLVFHIDQLFFAFYFLKSLNYFNKNAIIYSDEKIYYLSKNNLFNSSIKIKEVIIGNINKNLNYTKKTSFNISEKGLYSIKFEEGYIIVEK